MTPVMKTKVNPTLIQLLHFYGNYSFYILKWLKGKVRRNTERGLQGFKRELLVNSEKYIFDNMPTYLKDIAKFPGQVTWTHKLYTSLREVAGVSKQTIEELREFSSRIIYLETGGKNPYFLIKEAE
jgi:anaerobic magnesium-protoporphyrin IX monomethyl ester cyclase